MIRNLLYHIYPVKGNGVWQWNVAELRKRWHLFTGRKIIAVVLDDTTDSIFDVERAFGDDWDHRVSCVTVQNDPKLREVATFVDLMDDLDKGGWTEEEITFYAHAKGVTRGADNMWVKRWTNLLYQTNLDDIDLVESLLRRFPICGSCKRYGRFPQLRDALWHFSGTFFWFRNVDVFTRNWRKVGEKSHGVEAWPGIQFRPEEAACLFLDHCESLYEAHYWRGIVHKALSRWTGTLPQSLSRSSS